MTAVDEEGDRRPHFRGTGLHDANSIERNSSKLP